MKIATKLSSKTLQIFSRTKKPGKLTWYEELGMPGLTSARVDKKGFFGLKFSKNLKFSENLFLIFCGLHSHNNYIILPKFKN